MKPVETLDRQMDLYRWYGTVGARRYIEGWLASNYFVDYHQAEAYLSMTDPDAPGPPKQARAKGRAQAPQLIERERHTLYSAPTYWVSANMVALATHAAQSMALQPLKFTDLPTPSGFVWFEQPVHFTDVRGQTIAEQVILWVPGAEGPPGTWFPEAVTTGVALSYYSSWVDEADQGMQDLRRQHPEVPQVPLYDGSQPWMFDHDPADEKTLDWAQESAPADVRERAWSTITQQRTFMAALWALMQQEITVQTSVSPDRALRRRIQRSGLLGEAALEGVRVITLRKRKDQPVEREGESHPVEWSHQWIVNGHWRNQWYPSLGYHRQIWISPFVKGPADKPLVTKNTIFKLSR